MKILAFDTSTRFLSLTVSDGKKILRYANQRKNKFLSTSIMTSIQAFLKKNTMTLKDVDGLIIGLGPGSFISLRVGMATAKALAFANNIPLVGVCSLDLIALSVKSDGYICVMNDARRGLVFSCVYEKSGQHLKRLTDYRLDKPESFMSLMDNKNKTIFIGDGIPVYRELIQSALSKAVLIEQDKSFIPDARHLITLGYDWLKTKPKENLNPIYLYPDNCQVHKS